MSQSSQPKFNQTAPPSWASSLAEAFSADSPTHPQFPNELPQHFHSTHNDNATVEDQTLDELVSLNHTNHTNANLSDEELHYLVTTMMQQEITQDKEKLDKHRQDVFYDDDLVSVGEGSTGHSIINKSYENPQNDESKILPRMTAVDENGTLSAAQTVANEEENPAIHSLEMELQKIQRQELVRATMNADKRQRFRDSQQTSRNNPTQSTFNETTDKDIRNLEVLYGEGENLEFYKEDPLDEDILYQTDVLPEPSETPEAMVDIETLQNLLDTPISIPTVQDLQKGIETTEGGVQAQVHDEQEINDKQPSSLSNIPFIPFSDIVSQMSAKLEIMKSDFEQEKAEMDTFRSILTSINKSSLSEVSDVESNSEDQVNDLTLGLESQDHLMSSSLSPSQSLSPADSVNSVSSVGKTTKNDTQHSGTGSENEISSMEDAPVLDISTQYLGQNLTRSEVLTGLRQLKPDQTPISTNTSKEQVIRLFSEDERDQAILSSTIFKELTGFTPNDSVFEEQLASFDAAKAAESDPTKTDPETYQLKPLDKPSYHSILPEKNDLVQVLLPGSTEDSNTSNQSTVPRTITFGTEFSAYLAQRENANSSNPSFLDQFLGDEDDENEEDDQDQLEMEDRLREAELQRTANHYIKNHMVDDEEASKQALKLAQFSHKHWVERMKEEKQTQENQGIQSSDFVILRQENDIIMSRLLYDNLPKPSNGLKEDLTQTEIPKRNGVPVTQFEHVEFLVDVAAALANPSLDDDIDLTKDPLAIIDLTTQPNDEIPDESDVFRSVNENLDSIPDLEQIPSESTMNDGHQQDSCRKVPARLDTLHQFGRNSDIFAPRKSNPSTSSTSLDALQQMTGHFSQFSGFQPEDFDFHDQELDLLTQKWDDSYQQISKELADFELDQTLFNSRPKQNAYEDTIDMTSFLQEHNLTDLQITNSHTPKDTPQPAHLLMQDILDDRDEMF